VIKTFTQYPGALRPAGLRKGVAGLLVATFCMAGATGAHADVFGGNSAAAGPQPNAVLERLAALEKELKELKEKGGAIGAPPPPGAPVKDSASAKAKAKLKLPSPPPGLEGLPGGGVDERERLLVEKELTHEVLGTVNGMMLVRDGDKRFIMTESELKAFEKKKREAVIRRMKMDAATEVEGGKLNFPQLNPPPVPEGASDLSQAGQAVDQARAIEANGGQLPAAKPPGAAPAPAKPAAAAPAPAKPAAAPAPAPGQARPASPVQKH